MRNGEAASRDSLSDFSLAMIDARVQRPTDGPADRRAGYSPPTTHARLFSGVGGGETIHLIGTNGTRPPPSTTLRGYNTTCIYIIEYCRRRSQSVCAAVLPPPKLSSMYRGLYLLYSLYTFIDVHSVTILIYNNFSIKISKSTLFCLFFYFAFVGYILGYERCGKCINNFTMMLVFVFLKFFGWK